MIKSTSNNNEFSVGLDIGTSKICVMISKKDSTLNNYSLLGFGITESDGLSRGVVNNIEKVTLSVQKAVKQAQDLSGYEIDEVVVGIAGDHIQTLVQNGLITVSKGDSEISKEDVLRLIEEAKKTTMSADNKIIHTFPINFIVDSNSHTIDPVGMAGVRLEGEIMLVTALESAVNNLKKCVERAGLKLKKLVLEPIASSQATLTEEEKEIGVALVDIGGGTTDIAVYSDKILKYTSVIAVGGKLITSDVRKVLGITEVNAEAIKKEYGTCGFIENDTVINVPLGGGNKPKEIRRSDLNAIIRERTIEMLQFIKYELVQSKIYNELGAGVILTGGCALLDGIEDLAQEVLQLPVKIGIPKGFSMTALAPDISSPLYSTAVGLTLIGHTEQHNEEEKVKAEQETKNWKKPEDKKLIFDESINIENEEIETEKGNKNNSFDKVLSWFKQL